MLFTAAAQTTTQLLTTEKTEHSEPLGHARWVLSISSNTVIALAATSGQSGGKLPALDCPPIGSDPPAGPTPPPVPPPSLVEPSMRPPHAIQANGRSTTNRRDAMRCEGMSRDSQSRCKPAQWQRLGPPLSNSAIPKLGSPGFQTRCVRTCQGLRPRRAPPHHAIAIRPVLPFACLHGVGTPK